MYNGIDAATQATAGGQTVIQMLLALALIAIGSGIIILRNVVVGFATRTRKEVLMAKNATRAEPWNRAALIAFGILFIVVGALYGFDALAG